MFKTLGRCLGIGLALVAAGAVRAQVASDIAAERAALQADRQAIIAANLPMTDDQAEAFWPMYRDYRGEIAKIGDRIVKLVSSYAKNFETLTDEQATTMLNELLTLQHADATIKSDWSRKFAKVLPGRSLMRFYQLENKFDAVVRFDAAAQIPLVEAVAE